MVIFEKISAFPNNQYELAVYTFEFVLPNELPAGGLIFITFPDGFYSSLPSPPFDSQCSISGGLRSYQSCRLENGNSFVVITDQTYRSSSIIFSVNNVRNPAEGVVGGFQIRSYYDGLFLDITDMSQAREIKIFPKAEPILVQDVDFNPRNEGEVASYFFTFVPATPIESRTYVVITFPGPYDQRLGDKIVCTLGSDEIVCTIKNRQVWAEGITNYRPSGSKPLVVQVTGVVNPNRNDPPGFFTIGTILQNTYNYIDYNNQVGPLEVGPAPGWAQMHDIVPENIFSRWSDTKYLFNFTAKTLIPRAAAKGSVIIDFPKQFDIPNKQSHCFVYEGSDFAESLECSFFANSVSITGNTEDKSGLVTLYVSKVANPPDEITTDNLLVKTYDGFKKEIIAKSFANLDPFQFTFHFPGPLIKINGDQPIIVERGTQTTDLWITVEYPCALNLTFTPQPGGTFSIIPLRVKLSVTDLRAKFRVTVSESSPAGIYFITWNLAGDSSTNPFYTPVKKTEVRITAIKNIRINIDELNEIPTNGTSLDHWIQVDYAPDLGVEIILRPLTKTVFLSAKSIFLASGWNNASFRVYNNETEENRVKTLQDNQFQIQLSLEGINKDVFVLSRNILNVIFIPKDLEPPFITDLRTSIVKQTFVTITFGAGELCVIYYMIALIGSEKPSEKELLEGGPPPVVTTLSKYGKVNIGKENLATVLIDKLKAQTPFVIYAIAQDRAQLLSEIKSLEFWSASRYSAAEFTVLFKQSYLNQAERKTIRQKIAFVLSIPSRKVLEKDAFSSSSTEKRMLQSDEISTPLDLSIVSIPTTENFEPPLKLVDILNSRIMQLNDLVPNLNVFQTIKGTEFEIYYANFVEPPVNSNRTHYTCTVTGTPLQFQLFKGKLDNFGYIYVIATEAALDKEKPRAMQVYWGYNSKNVLQPRGWTIVTEKFKDSDVTIRNLKPDTDYNLYMVGGSAHPGYPDIPDDKNVALVTCRTEAFPPNVFLDINNGIVQALTILLFIISLT